VDEEGYKRRGRDEDESNTVTVPFSSELESDDVSDKDAEWSINFLTGGCFDDKTFDDEGLTGGGLLVRGLVDCSTIDLRTGSGRGTGSGSGAGAAFTVCRLRLLSRSA